MGADQSQLPGKVSNTGTSQTVFDSASRSVRVATYLEHHTPITPDPSDPNYGLTIGHPEKLTVANGYAQQLINSLKSIPPDAGTARLVVHPETAAPKKVIIHLRQIHVPAQTSCIPVPEGQEKACKGYLRGQEQVEKVVRHLHDALGLKKVYDEAITDQMDTILTIGRENQGRRQELENKYATKSVEETVKTLVSLTNAGQQDTEQWREMRILAYIQGSESASNDPSRANYAGLRLETRGLINLLPGEDAELGEASKKPCHENPFSSECARALDKRDDHLVKKMATGEPNPAVSLLGGEHDLDEEVREWNTNHPENPIALVEIDTPEAKAKDQEFLNLMNLPKVRALIKK